MYLLDANILITAADVHYPVDVVPNFWDEVLRALQAGDVRIPFSVYNEVTRQQGRWLTRWIKQNIPATSPMVLPEDHRQVADLAEITRWVLDPQRSFGKAHVNSFLGGADPRIIAAAKTEDAQIVTYEKFISDPNVRKVKIPNVAQPFGVVCVEPIPMFRALGRTF